MLADLLGITPEQRRELMGEEGLERMGEQLKDAEQSVREALGSDGLRGARTRGVRAWVARWRRWCFRTRGLLLPELKSLLLLSACMV